MIDNKGAAETETKCLAIPKALHRPANKSPGLGIRLHGLGSRPLSLTQTHQALPKAPGCGKEQPKTATAHGDCCTSALSRGSQDLKDLSINSRCVVCGISERRIAQQSSSGRGEPATQLSSHQPRDAIGRTSADCQPPSIFSPAPSHAACSLQFHAAEPGFCEWIRGQATGLWRGTSARGGGWPWLAPGLAAPVRTYAVGRSCRTILLSKPCFLGAQESEGEYKTKLCTSLCSPHQTQANKSFTTTTLLIA